GRSPLNQREMRVRKVNIPLTNNLHPRRRVDSDLGQLYHPRGMGQFHHAGVRTLLLVIAMVIGCGKTPDPPVPAKKAASPSVASLVPAATDLLIGMGLGDHLAAVSNFEPKR